MLLSELHNISAPASSPPPEPAFQHMLFFIENAVIFVGPSSLPPPDPVALYPPRPCPEAPCASIGRASCPPSFSSLLPEMSSCRGGLLHSPLRRPFGRFTIVSATVIYNSFELGFRLPFAFFSMPQYGLPVLVRMLSCLRCSFRAPSKLAESSRSLFSLPPFTIVASLIRIPVSFPLVCRTPPFASLVPAGT